MTQQPVIRDARAEDVARLTEIAIAAKAHWGYSAAFMAACRAELTVSVADLAALSVAVLETDRPIGFYALEWRSDGTAELDALFVEPAFIGQGFGRLLISAAAAAARARGVETLVIQADPNAAAFYEAIGARRVGERESASIPGRQLPLYEWTIDGA
jgi:GNAT superfamily N-acetyltransferase